MIHLSQFESLAKSPDAVQVAPAGGGLFEASYLRVYWALLASFLVLGVCITFAQPIFSVPDEDMHWAAGHARIERVLGDEGCVRTVPPAEDHRRWPQPPLPRAPSTNLVCTKEWVVYGGYLTYPGLIISKLILPGQTASTLRQVNGVLLTRLLQGMMVGLCLLRLGQLAKRARRTGALLVASFCMSPLLAQQAFGVSADGAQLAFGICLACVTLYWTELSAIDGVLFLLIGWGATAKPFVLTCILPSVLAGYWFSELRRNPSSTFRQVARGLFGTLRLSRRPTAQTFVAWAALGLSALTVAFALYGTHADPALQRAGSLPNGVDARAQAIAIVSHPGRFAELINQMEHSPLDLDSYVGPLGLLDSPMSPVVVHRFEWLVLFAAFIEVLYAATTTQGLWRAAALKLRLRLLARSIAPVGLGLLGPVANVFLVAAVLYSLWTPYGHPVIHGVQGRYFLGSTLALLGVLGGATSLLLSGPSHVPDQEPTRRQRAWARVIGIAAPALVWAMTLPLVTRVFVDLSRRYG